jgi:hypothetical protein
LALKDLWQQTVTAQGAMDFDVRGEGISPRRLPAWTRLQTPPMMDVMVRMPAGVRLRFATRSATLGISFHATNLVTPPNRRRPIVFDLEIGSQHYSEQSQAGNTIQLNPARPGEFELLRGDSDTLVFEDLDPGLKQCELWLPHNAFIELRALVIDDDSEILPAETDSRSLWIHYGSSISHCMEADQPGLIWPAVAARRAGVSLQNLGFGGQCHLDQFVARTIRDVDADVISIKAGINVINMDSMRERVFGPVLHGFLDTIRERRPDTPIMLISPIYCPSAETRPGPTLPDGKGKFVTIPGFERIRAGCMSLARVREIITEVVESRRQSGDLSLHYLNGLELFGEADKVDLPDDLHPNPAGYVRMGERFAPYLADLLSTASD